MESGLAKPSAALSKWCSKFEALMKKQLLLITLFLATAVALPAAEVPDEADIQTLTEDSLRSFGLALLYKDFA